MKRSSNATLNIVVGVVCDGKTFINDEARQRYSSDFSHCLYTVARTIDFDFFNKARIDLFKNLEHIGWGPFFSLTKNIYSEMIKEFYSNLVFNADSLRTTSLIKGRKIELSQEFMADVLGCPNEGIERYYSHKEVPNEGYSCDRAIRELMEGKSDSIDVSRLSVSNRVLLSAISQMVILLLESPIFPPS